jgi:hypothetical protein
MVGSRHSHSRLREHLDVGDASPRFARTPGGRPAEQPSKPDPGPATGAARFEYQRTVICSTKGGFMESVLLDVAGHRHSPAIMPGHHRGRPPRTARSSVQPSRSGCARV